MELFFSENFSLLLFIVILMFLKPEKLKDNQKVFLCYTMIFLIDMSNKIKSTYIYLILFVTLFIYFEYLNNSYFKKYIMTNFFDKLADFIYIMCSQYCFVSYTLLLFSNTVFARTFIYSWFNNYYILYLFQFFLIVFITNSLYELNWELKDLDTIKKEIESVIHINKLPKRVNKYNFSIVLKLEDKSYYLRKKYTTAYTIDYVKNYICPKLANEFPLNNELNNFILNKNTFKKIIIKLKSLTIWIKDIYNHIHYFFTRGHSTIEAQLLRSIGIKQGYDDNIINIIKRKVFEIIYTHIVFNNLYDYYKKKHYENSYRMKDYLLYVYLHKAKVKYNKIPYTGLKSLYGKPIEQLSNNELFVGTLMFSKYNLKISDIEEYSIIYDNPIEYDECDEIVNSFRKNW